MLVPLGDITESVAYQEIFAEGEIKGKIEGVKGQINLLEGMLIDGVIARDDYLRTITPLRQQLAELQES